MKPSIKATLAVYINLLCLVVEIATGICAIILTSYELVFVFVGYFYEANESTALDDYDSASTAAYVYQYQSEQPTDSTKTVVWYNQELQRLGNDEILPTNDE